MYVSLSSSFWREKTPLDSRQLSTDCQTSVPSGLYADLAFSLSKKNGCYKCERWLVGLATSLIPTCLGAAKNKIKYRTASSFNAVFATNKHVSTHTVEIG